MAKTRRSPATKFLWIVAIVTMLVIVGALFWRTFQAQLLKWVLVPTVEFTETAMPDGRTYGDASMWIARPGVSDDPSTWRPRDQPAPPPPRASVFFVHPTSFLETSAWNGSVVDEASCPESGACPQWRASLYIRSQASAFNGVGQVWAPRYRQATFGAFLTDKDEARRALDFAYRDVLAAYEQFLREAPADRPIILAGHSQGSFHLMRLLHERIKNSPEQRRIAAAYLVGWPISPTVDLPQLPLPACARAGQAGCIVSWASFSEPADPSMIVDTWQASSGLDGQSRGGSTMVCVNPLTGNAGDGADAAANRGTLIPNDSLTDAEFVTGAIPGRCDDRGFLLIGESPPPMGPYVLPGNNYHVYDYTLFWGNARADAEARLATFLSR